MIETITSYLPKILDNKKDPDGKDHKSGKKKMDIDKKISFIPFELYDRSRIFANPVFVRVT